MALPDPEKPHTQHAQHEQQQLAIPDEKTFARLSPVPSSTSTVEAALDAEAGIAGTDQGARQEPASAKNDDDDDPGPPPNGGFKAWLQVAGSFFLFFNCW